MKKLLLIALIGLMSCGPSREELQREGAQKHGSVTKHIDYSGLPDGVSVIKVDDCEYICVEGNGVAITHKANCLNHISQ
jgi:hypothetical protein